MTESHPDGEKRVYPYQFAFLNEKSRFTITVKARQVGFSYAFALRGLTKALQEPNYSALYLSLNQRDAEEKIRYARLLYHSQPKSVRKKIRLVRDSLQEMAFSNGSRLLSLPCSSGLRGKSGHLYLDEFAHF
ncbi:MAG: terminase large subunit domain-containing protein, partial [bacterium]